MFSPVDVYSQETEFSLRPKDLGQWTISLRPKDLGQWTNSTSPRDLGLGLIVLVLGI